MKLVTGFNSFIWCHSILYRISFFHIKHLLIIITFIIDELNNKLKSELNMTNQLNKSLEKNFKKMCEHSSQLKNECEIKNKEYLEKDQQLSNA